MFLNVPFDADYEPLMIALVAALTAHELTPRNVVEIVPKGGQRFRLDRLIELIRRCASSVHDLSRVQTAKCNNFGRVPRFNMPFELGLAASDPDHAWYVLEQTSHRVECTLNDINGVDPKIHGGTPEGILDAIGDLFGVAGGSPSRATVKAHLARLQTAARSSKKEHKLLSKRGFEELVAIAQKLWAART